MGKKKLVFLFLLLSLSGFSQINNIAYFNKDVWFKDTVHFKNSADTADIYIYNNKIYFTSDNNIDSIIFVKKGTTTALKTNLAGAGGGSGTVTSVGAGYGMNFSTITTTGNVIGDSAIFIPKSSRSVINSQKTFTDSVTVGSNFFKIRNPSSTFQYTFKGAAILGSYDLTLPLITANSVIATNTIDNVFTSGQSTLNAGGVGKGFTAVSNSGGTGSYSAMEVYNDVSSFAQLAMMGSGFTTAGVKIASRAILESTSSVGLAIVANHASGIIRFASGGTTEVGQFDASGRLGIGVTPTAYLHTKAGTTTIASLNIPVGSALTTKVDGAIYRTATDLFMDSATVEYVIPHGLKGTYVLAISATIIAGTVSTFSTTVTGARVRDIVTVSRNYTTSSDKLIIDAYVSATNTVIIRVQNWDSADLDIPAQTFNLFVMK